MRALLAALAVATCASCAVESPPSPQSLDRAFFRCRVEPVLVDSCAFYACHGSADRPFRIYGPNRLRLGVPEAQRALALTVAEHDHNYRAALRFAQPVDGYAEPLLVEKPLDASLGGAFHRGAEDYAGGDVFVSEGDPGLAAIRDWLSGATEESPCAP